LADAQASDALADPDGDRLNNLQEYLAGTDPTDRGSALRIGAAVGGRADAFVIRWSSASNRCYTVERSGSLFDGFAPLQSNIWATPPQNVFTDRLDDATAPVLYYRIRLQRQHTQ
jgi:hypothetical protein